MNEPEQTASPLPLCMNCKHFGIAHELSNLYSSDDATPEQRKHFTQSVIVSHGVCTRVSEPHYVTGIVSHPLAINERRFGGCMHEGKYFEEILSAQERTD